MRVSICGIPHEVIELEDHFDIDSHLGQIEYKDCLIKINKGLAPELKAATICHEVLHGLLTHIGRYDLSEDETFVTALGTALNGSFAIKEMYDSCGELTLDNAIEHCYDVASVSTDSKCAEDHRMLALWLKELRQYRRQYGGE